MQFKDVVGLTEAKTQLVKNYQRSRVPHAQLFLGPEGAGALPLALAFAQLLLCENPREGDSCGECNHCTKAASLTHPDLHLSFPTVMAATKSDEFVGVWRNAVLENPYISTLDWLRIATEQVSEGQTKAGNITVEESRNVIRKLGYKTFEAKRKVLVLWRAEYLQSAGNVLLKLIEEPPPETYIILTAHDQNLLLPTIQSRTQMLRLPPLTDREIADYIIEQSGADETTGRRVARLADGSLSAALSLLNQPAIENAQLFKAWMRCCFRPDPKQVVAWVDSLASRSREEQKTFIAYALGYFRESLTLPFNVGQSRLFEEETEGANYLATNLEVEHFQLMAEALDMAAEHLQFNANPKILFTEITLRLIEILEGERTMPQLHHA